MKKVFLLCALFVVQLQLPAQAQTIPNVGFESWQSTPYDEPNGWASSNPESFRKTGTINSTKVSGQSGSAIRLETVISNGDTGGAYVVNNGGQNPENGEGGVPYSQKPSNLTGYYKYTPGAIGDSAIVLVIFKKASQIISMDFYKLGPAATFTSFSLPINYILPLTPDSVIIGAASSNLLDEVGIADGSVLIIDELAFTGTGITQSIPNGNFENWTTKSIDRLNNWNVGGEGVTRTNDKHSGTYAAMLQTTESDDGNANPAQISTGMYTQSGPQKGGQPYSRQNDTLVGWYKYSGTADSAEVQVTLKKSGNIIQGFRLPLGPASNYTEFSLPLNASQTPDSIIVNIQSSKWPPSPTAAGSTLTIDDVRLKSEPVGISKIGRRSFRVTAFPNPASEQLSLTLPEKKNGTLCIYDVSGKKLMTQTVNDKTLNVDVKSLENGVYFYELTTEKGEVTWDRFVKE
jgi:hypothetical protein